MPAHCSVPFCKGNYSSGPVVSAFQFPKDEILRKKWILAIRRKDFKVTKHSKVCGLHFLPEEVEREASCYDEKTGKTVTAKLDVPRLKKGAVPSVFAWTNDNACQTDEESFTPRWTSQSGISQNGALHTDVKETKNFKLTEDRYFSTYVDLVRCVKEFSDYIPDVWTFCEKSNHALFAVIKLENGAQITSSVLINSDLELSAYYRSIPLKEAGSYSLPLFACSIRMILDILNELSFLASL